jgi:hypothetical protein
MKNLFLAIFFFISAWLRAEERALMDFDWRKQAPPDKSSEAVLRTVNNRSVLVIQHTNGAPLTMSLLRLSKPQISSELYAIVGEIRYEKVEGQGYLEMWSSFPPANSGLPEARYFSRTLAESGKTGRITGTAGWRRFVVPFNRTGTSNPPIRLEFNLVLPGSGTVYLGSTKLVEYPAGTSMDTVLESGAWWSDRAGGWIGGTMGSVLGCLAGLLAWLAGKGMARGFVLVTLIVLISLGGLLSLAGIVALMMRQPYGVWFVLLLPGILALTILPARLVQFRRNYENLELRRMASLDTP